MKSVLLAIACSVCALTLSPAFSQDRPADTTPILQEKLRAEKKFLVANNLPLLEREAAVFWSIYDAYQAELALIDGRIATIIIVYQEADLAEKLDDVMARKLAEEMLAVEDDEGKLRHRYHARLLQVLPPITVARYLQIEGKIRAAQRYEITSKVPLIEERKPEHRLGSAAGI